MSDNHLQDVLRALPGKRVLVAGDLMMDEYIMGSVRRISPEAPVPVVEIQRRTHVPGGAANTAANVAGLGGRPVLVGVVGQDPAGAHLREAVEKRGVCTDGLVVDADRPTTTKTRIVAHSQQVVRVDQEERAPLPRHTEDKLLRAAAACLENVDACVVSDYAKGVVSARFAEHLIASARRAGKPVVVDPKGTAYEKYRGATVVKPNVHEAGQVLNCEMDGIAALLRAGRDLLALLEGSAVLITRGAQGMSLFLDGVQPLHIPAEARDVYDVTGAGDTVASTLGLALAAGASLTQAARLANRAAAVVVGKVGTTAVRLHDLLGPTPAREGELAAR
jgi:D-glycero-beta-D-manno-heptose-7-phosphate kinase